MSDGLGTYPRWIIARRDGGLIMGEYAWMDAGSGDRPDWVCADDADWDDLDQFYAIKVDALEYRAHPATRVPCPVDDGCHACGPNHWHLADGSMGHAEEDGDPIANRPMWDGWTVKPSGEWVPIDITRDERPNHG